MLSTGSLVYSPSFNLLDASKNSFTTSPLVNVNSPSLLTVLSSFEYFFTKSDHFSPLFNFSITSLAVLYALVFASAFSSSVESSLASEVIKICLTVKSPYISEL